MATQRMAAPPGFTAQLFQQLAGKNGRLSASEIGNSGLRPPPKGYQYTYDFNNPQAPLALKKDGNATLARLGAVAKVAVPMILAATGVGAPAAAAIMAGTYAADAKANGRSWGDAALSGAIGGATGAIGAGALGNASTGTRLATNAAVGAAEGAQGGGGMRGALIGGAAGAATGAMANRGVAGAAGAANPAANASIGSVNGLQITPYAQSVASNMGRSATGQAGRLATQAATNGTGAAGTTAGAGGTMASGGGWGGVLQDLARNPETYRTIAQVAGRAGEGAAGERGNANDFADRTAGRQTSQYGVAQSARNNLLAQQEQGRMNRASLGISAPSARMKQAILGSILQNLQDVNIQAPEGVTMGRISGGLRPSLLSAATRAGGGELERQALLALMTKSDIPEMSDFVGEGTVAPPNAPQYQEPGGLETALSTIGLLGGVGGAMSEIERINQQQPPRQPRPRPRDEMDATSRAALGL